MSANDATADCHPPGRHAGRLLAHSTPPGSDAPSSRGHLTTPVSMPSFYSFDASAVVHTRSSSRRPPDPLTAGLQPQRSPPRLLTDAACGGLSAPPARRTRRANLHHRHSTSRSGDLLHRHHSTSGHTQVEVVNLELSQGRESPDLSGGLSPSVCFSAQLITARSRSHHSRRSTHAGRRR